MVSAPVTVAFDVGGEDGGVAGVDDDVVVPAGGRGEVDLVDDVAGDVLEFGLGGGLLVGEGYARRGSLPSSSNACDQPTSRSVAPASSSR